MTTVETECPQCSTLSRMPIGALMLEVAAADADDQVGGAISWICESCAALVGRPIGWDSLVALVAAGADPVEEPEEDLRPVYPESAAAGPALTPDDLLDLHAELAGDGWFGEVERVAAADQR
jgi:hypothetical protein